VPTALEVSKKQNAAVKQYGTTAAVYARKGALQLRQAAIKAVRSGDLPDLSKMLVRSSLPLITEMMNVSFLQGFINSKRGILRRGKPMSLAFETVIDALNKNANVDIFKITTVNKSNAKDVIEKAASHVEDKLKSTVLDLIKRGVTTREAIGEINDTMDLLGMSPEKDFLLETMYRSAATTAYSAGQWGAYQDPDVNEILWGYQYSAVGDDRTRENHLAADGVTLPKNHEFWETMWPPNGYNCRCVVVPLFEEEDIVEPPDGAYPDEGFGFNPGIEIPESALSLAFDPDQPRDESGKWTAGGGGGTSAGEKIPAKFNDRLKMFKQKFPSFSPSIIKKLAAINDRATAKGVVLVPKKLTPAEVLKVKAAFPSAKVMPLNALNYMKANPPGSVPKNSPVSQIIQKAISSKLEKNLAGQAQYTPPVKALQPASPASTFGIGKTKTTPNGANLQKILNAKILSKDSTANAIIKLNKFAAPDKPIVVPNCVSQSKMSKLAGLLGKPVIKEKDSGSGKPAKPNWKQKNAEYEAFKILNHPGPKYPVTETPRYSNIDGGEAAQKAWESKLTYVEKNALSQWGDSQYKSIREGEKHNSGGKSTETGKKYAKVAKDFNAALDRAPKFTGEVYRGLYITPDSKHFELFTTPGKVIHMHGTQSASRSNQKPFSFGGHNMILHVTELKDGVDISQLTGLAGEKEVVLRVNSKYEVLSVEKNVMLGTKVTQHLVKVRQIQ
jgi:SPP1 gp7 family putative phage head morphogenesis protein